jgi:hypothetical protein
MGLKIFADLIAFLNFSCLDLLMLRSEVLVLVRVLTSHQLKFLSNQISPLVSVSKRLKLIRVKLQIHLVLNALLLKRFQECKDLFVEDVAQSLRSLFDFQSCAGDLERLDFCD